MLFCPVITLLLLPDVVTVMVTVVSGWLVAAGLNVHAVPTGRPLHPRATMPSDGSSSSTSKVNFAAPPCGVLALPPWGVTTSGGPRLIASVAVLLLGFTSPPPETLAVLLKLFWMLIGMFTVNVIGG